MNTDDRPPLCVVKIPVRNRGSRTILVRLEPWGEEHALPPGGAWSVVARGPDVGESLEVLWEGDRVTVYGWPGATVALLRDGVDVAATPGTRARVERAPVPRMPAGMRVREWVDGMAALAHPGPRRTAQRAS